MLWNREDDSHSWSTGMPRDGHEQSKSDHPRMLQTGKPEMWSSGLQMPWCRSYSTGAWQNHLWPRWGMYQDSCWKEEFAPALVMAQKEEIGLSSQRDNIIYCPDGGVASTAFLGGRRGYLLCKWGRNSHNSSWQCEYCTGRSFVHPNCMKRMPTGGCQEE